MSLKPGDEDLKDVINDVGESERLEVEDKTCETPEESTGMATESRQIVEPDPKKSIDTLEHDGDSDGESEQETEQEEIRDVSGFDSDADMGSTETSEEDSSDREEDVEETDEDEDESDEEEWDEKRYKDLFRYSCAHLTRRVLRESMKLSDFSGGWKKIRETLFVADEQDPDDMDAEKVAEMSVKRLIHQLRAICERTMGILSEKWRHARYHSYSKLLTEGSFAESIIRSTMLKNQVYFYRKCEKLEDEEKRFVKRAVEVYCKKEHGRWIQMYKAAIIRKEEGARAPPYVKLVNLTLETIHSLLPKDLDFSNRLMLIRRKELMEEKGIEYPMHARWSPVILYEWSQQNGHKKVHQDSEDVDKVKVNDKDNVVPVDEMWKIGASAWELFVLEHTLKALKHNWIHNLGADIRNDMFCDRIFELVVTTLVMNEDVCWPEENLSNDDKRCLRRMMRSGVTCFEMDSDEKNMERSIVDALSPLESQFQGVLFVQPKAPEWSDLPRELHEEVVGYLNIFDRTSLGLCSHADHELTRHLRKPMLIPSVELVARPLNNIVHVFIYFGIEDWAKMTFKRDKTNTLLRTSRTGNKKVTERRMPGNPLKHAAILMHNLLVKHKLTVGKFELKINVAGSEWDFTKWPTHVWPLPEPVLTAFQRFEDMFMANWGDSKMTVITGLRGNFVDRMATVQKEGYYLMEHCKDYLPYMTMSDGKINHERCGFTSELTIENILKEAREECVEDWQRYGKIVTREALIRQYGEQNLALRDGWYWKICVAPNPDPSMSPKDIFDKIPGSFRLTSDGAKLKSLTSVTHSILFCKLTECGGFVWIQTAEKYRAQIESFINAKCGLGPICPTCQTPFDYWFNVTGVHRRLVEEEDWMVDNSS